MQTVNGHRVEFIISARGNLQLLIDDHTFCMSKTPLNLLIFPCAPLFNSVLQFTGQNEVLQKKTYYICCQTKVIGCPARVRLVHVNNRVEIKNLNHNHPVVVGRRQIGEASKLKNAWKKAKRLEKKSASEETEEEFGEKPSAEPKEESSD